MDSDKKIHFTDHTKPELLVCNARRCKFQPMNDASLLSHSEEGTASEITTKSLVTVCSIVQKHLDTFL